MEDRILVVVAHPDDEAIGCGAQLWRMLDVLILHVTDGAPAGREAARAAGFPDRRSYASARAEEAKAAAVTAGAPHARFLGLGVTDQEATFEIGRIRDRIAALVRDFRPRAVLTHPYEGGHPDHDSTALATRLACAILQRDGEAPPVLEMTFYHRDGEEMATGRFLGGAATQEVVAVLRPEERERKRRVLDCYRSQQAMLARFGCDAERFRVAPAYDYGAPPHAAPLWYELFDWGVDGARWRTLAAAAMAADRVR